VPHRFYAPGISLSAPVTLPDEEAEHLLRVLRLQAGDEVEAFDGAGRMYLAVVDRAGRRSAALRALSVTGAAPEPGVRLRLVVAALKGDKTDDVVRDAAMLGVSAIQPVVTARSEIGLASLARSHRVQRWQRIAVSSVKQSGRAVVPAVSPPLAFDEYVAQPSSAHRLMLAEPSVGLGATPVGALDKPGAADLIVGPEGGWTEAEVGLASRSGARLVTLGGRTLRADATPLVALAAVLTAWGEL
jgi:16S rRNA (uracil1498-N3)-methyltransferase